MDNLSKTIKGIKDLKIQGATSIAKESVKTLGLWSNQRKWTIKQLTRVAEKLAFARPTEPLAQNCIYWLLDKAKIKEGKSLYSDVEEIIAELTKTKERSIEVGSRLIKNGATILTHCHSSTVVAIFKNAFKKKLKFKVIMTETRPRYQGHITARELLDLGIDTTMITDSEAAYIISHEDKIEVDLIIVGADAINTDGSALNKIGSYGISLTAHEAKIPLYVAATLLKFTPLPIIIEQRSSQEVWKNHPQKLKILNLAFDKIPKENINTFITEVGLIKPKDIKETVKKIYPWIFNKEQHSRIKKWLKQIPY